MNKLSKDKDIFLITSVFVVFLILMINDFGQNVGASFTGSLWWVLVVSASLSFGDELMIRLYKKGIQLAGTTKERLDIEKKLADYQERMGQFTAMMKPLAIISALIYLINLIGIFN